MNIALVGEMGSGKDTVAKLLEPYGYKRLSLADPIRRCLQMIREGDLQDAYAFLRGIDRKDRCNSWWFILQASREPNKRKALQGLGTGLVEGDTDIWINHAMEKVSLTPYVVTDCRRQRELERFKREGCLLIFIEASLETRKKRLQERDGGFDETTFEHEAEAEIRTLKPLCHVILDNNGEDLCGISAALHILEPYLTALRPREEAGK